MVNAEEKGSEDLAKILALFGAIDSALVSIWFLIAGFAVLRISRNAVGIGF